MLGNIPRISKLYWILVKMKNFRMMYLLTQYLFCAMGFVNHTQSKPDCWEIFQTLENLLDFF